MEIIYEFKPQDYSCPKEIPSDSLINHVIGWETTHNFNRKHEPCTEILSITYFDESGHPRTYGRYTKECPIHIPDIYIDQYGILHEPKIYTFRNVKIFTNGNSLIPPIINSTPLYPEYTKIALQSSRKLSTFVERYNLLVRCNGDMQTYRLAYSFGEKGYGMSKLGRFTLNNMISKELCPLLTRIGTPRISRIPENPNKNTFDFVHLEFGVIQKNTCPNRNEILKKHRYEIIDIASKVIESYKPYQKYGIPVNFLKCTSMSITNTSNIAMIFELKELNTEMKGTNQT